MKDTQIAKLIQAESARQKKVINLIASENYVSKDVLEALGSELTNKYSEGYPGHRYYGGNEIIDKIETLAQDRALKLFKLDSKKWAVNVQALSGSPANFAVYTALLPKNRSHEERGKIMGMSLAHGGHLTHGHKVSATGMYFDQIAYGVDTKTETLNYSEIEKIALENKPDIIVAGFTAYPRKIDWKKFRQIANKCKAILMVDMSHISGLIAGGVYESPFDYADVVTTTTHKALRGPRSALIFSRKDKFIVDKKGKKNSYAELIDKAIFPGLQGGPHQNQIAAIAVALKEASAGDFKKYAKQIIKNANTLATELQKLGWRVISGGTDTHLILIDTWMNGQKNEKGCGAISGQEAELKLEKAGIIVNKNTIPNDPRGPFDPSGIRLGTPAETTRGKKEGDFIKIAKKIDEVLKRGV
jgi:glycine hydroxymethyltransferase